MTSSTDVFKDEPMPQLIRGSCPGSVPELGIRFFASVLGRCRGSSNTAQMVQTLNLTSITNKNENENETSIPMSEYPRLNTQSARTTSKEEIKGKTSPNRLVLLLCLCPSAGHG
jgi:hypothetical protein